MDLQKIYSDSDFQNAVVPEGQILVFNGIENGKPVTRYKDSSGNFGTISGTGVEITLGQINETGAFQALAFNGTEAAADGEPETVESYYGWNGVLPSPNGGIKVYNIGDAAYYKCASVDTVNKTWAGYKAVLNDGIYTFDPTLVEGLSYGDNFVPTLGKIYDNGCTLVIDSLFMPGEIDFGASSNISSYGQALIPASFSTSGKSNDAYRPYRTETDSGSYIFTGPTENLKSCSSTVVTDAAFGINPASVFVGVHGYTDLSDQYTVTSITIEGSNDMENWDELGRKEGVNDTGEWTILCTPKQPFYKSLRAVFTSAQEGKGAILWKVRYSGIYYECDRPTASPYNPSGLESDGYSITYSYTWWDGDRPWRAFNFRDNAAVWGSNTTDKGVGQWLSWESQTAKCIKRYMLRAGTDNSGVGFALQGYDETSGQWVNISERVADSSDGAMLFDCSSNTGKYKKHRIICTSMASGAHFQLSHIAAWE